MTKHPRFKIDLRSCPVFPIGLFKWEQGWLWGRWDQVQIFNTPEEARKQYEEIKDLPEYLA